MVRPAASKSNKELMLLFANMTTYPTENPMDWIARTGNVSVYSAFSQCCASCVRMDKQGPSDGLAPLESNKVLEDNGYTRVRSRRAKPTLPSEIAGDGSDGPSYYYSNRRWRNPSDPADCAILRQSWDQLVSKHRHVSLACTFEKMLEVVERCRNIWAIKNPVLAKKRLGSYSKKAKRLSNGRFAPFDPDNPEEEEEGEEEGGEEEEERDLSALEQLSSLAMKKAKLEQGEATSSSGEDVTQEPPAQAEAQLKPRLFASSPRASSRAAGATVQRGAGGTHGGGLAASDKTKTDIKFLVD